MRLLHTTHLTFKEWFGTCTEPYAILSHCWSHTPGSEEVTYQQVISQVDLCGIWGYQKILQCCEIAKSRGFEWAWIDTCCIDKTSSSELSETINSMFAYYRDSAECYAFLDDVFDNSHGHGDERLHSDSSPPRIPDLDRSRWFTRGWTLQELLAPSEMLFFNHSRDFIGTRTELAPRLSAITGIHSRYLTRSASIREASVAQRMSWASSRETTRTEDTAYSLLGIFDVNMPLLYGEGNRAFQRLQIGIIERLDDSSIFAWRINEEYNRNNFTGVLAGQPSDFTGCNSVERLQKQVNRSNHSIQGSFKEISIRYNGLIFDDPTKVRFIPIACQIVENESTVRMVELVICIYEGRCCRGGLKKVTLSSIGAFMNSIFSQERTVYLMADLADGHYASTTRSQEFWSISNAVSLPRWSMHMLNLLTTVSLFFILLIAFIFSTINPLAPNSVAIVLAFLLVFDIRIYRLLPMLVLLGALSYYIYESVNAIFNDPNPSTTRRL